MTHKEKINKMLEELPKKGIKKSYLNPPLYKLCWKLGFELPPPLFASFFNSFLLAGIYFGIFWGLSMWLFFKLEHENQPIIPHIIISILSGILFGLSMAIIYKIKKKKYNLPSWENYGSINLNKK